MALSTTESRIVRRTDRRSGLRTVVSIAAPLAFVAAQTALAVYDWQHVHRSAFAHGWVAPHLAAFHWVANQLFAGLWMYAGLAAASLILVRLGFRVLWVLPAVLFSLVPWLATYHTPQFVGQGWYALVGFGHVSLFVGYCLGAAVDTVLVLAPAGTWVGSVAPRPRRRVTFTDAVAVAIIAGAVVVGLRAMEVVDNSGPGAGVVWSVCIFALLASTSRPWWPWAPVAVALAVSGVFGSVSGYVGLGSTVSSDAVTAAPVVLCAFFASCWEPLSSAMRRSEESPLALLVAVNVLNIADALFTQFAVRAGQATELNPLVRTIGLPAKILGVGLLSWLLYRKRPALLLIPAAALLVVLAYHVSGLFIDT